MFKHNMKYSLKTLLRNKSLVFWTMGFPIIMSILFFMAFSKITSDETFDPIDVAIIKDDNLNNYVYFKTAIGVLSDKNSKDQVFNAKYVNENKAKKLLDEKDIVGYIKIDNDMNPVITVRKNSVSATIIKTVIDELQNQIKLVGTITNNEIANNPELEIDYTSIYMKAYQMVNSVDLNIKDSSPKKMDYASVEYYTLIAMSALYGGILSMFTVSRILPNMSEKGKRVAITPLRKSISIISGLIASFTVQLSGLILLLLFTTLVLHVDYGTNMYLVFLVSFMGSFAGLALGLFVGSIFKTSENNKMGILVSLTMFFSFFAGMFGISMKNIIDKNIPIINKLNPAALITDGLYSLYYYGFNTRYVMDLVYLFIISIVLILISINTLRRVKYDSI